MGDESKDHRRTSWLLRGEWVWLSSHQCFISCEEIDVSGNASGERTNRLRLEEEKRLYPFLSLNKEIVALSFWNYENNDIFIFSPFNP